MISRTPSVVQGRGFLRIYANHLGLDPKILLVDWEANPSNLRSHNFESFSDEIKPAAPAVEELPPNPHLPPLLPSHLRRLRQHISPNPLELKRHLVIPIQSLKRLVAS